MRYPFGVDSISALLSARAAEGGDRGYVLLEGDREAERASYAEVDLRARRIAALLRANHPAGARALLMYPQGVDFLSAFFGCLYAGVTAVPAYPPDPARLHRTLPRLEAIVRDAEVTMVLTTAPIAAIGAAMPPGMSSLQALPWYATDEAGRRPGAEALSDLHPADGRSLAFVQYTSGSTSAPKGVLVSHGNLLHNMLLMRLVSRDSPIDAVVGWVPQFHDMGLVVNSLMPVFLGALGVFISPLEFLRDPGSWLRAITRYRAQLSGGPNFAFDLCVRKVPEAERAALDLRSWSMAFNSAEPIRAETLERFAAAFGPCGFHRGAFLPSYGMAETTLGVSIYRQPDGPRWVDVDAAALERGRATPSAPGAGVRLVSSGPPRHEMEMAIVEPEARRRLGEREVGEIWVRGPSVAEGYLGKRDLTAEVFGAHTTGGEGPYLRTGDLGFLSGGELFVTGRRKDLIILRGRNHYPQDLERSAEAAHPAVRPGCVNAFSIDEGGEERLVLVAEVQPERAEDLLAVATAITQRVAEGHDLLVHRVALTPPRALPKTSSGKLQRGACRAELLGGTLPLLRSFCGAELLGAYVRARLASVLGVAPEQVDLDRPLEALGVDSLALAELDASLDRTLGVRLGLGAMGAGVSVASLAAGLGAGEARRGADEEAAVDEDREAASLVQEAIYRDHEALPGCHGISIGVRLLGEVREGALRDALDRLGARHGLLRGGFARSEGRLLRRPSAAAPELRVLDATSLSEGALREVLAEEATAPFAVEAGPLLRALLLRRAPAEWLLVLSLHHLAYDAYSLLALTHELVADLGGALPRGTAEDSAADYGRFVAWERRYLDSADCGRDEARLRTALAGAPLGVPLPPAGAGARIQDQAAALLRADDVARAAAGRAATPHGLILGAFLLGLRSQLGRDDLVVGTTVSLRDEPDLRAPLGPVFNYVPIRAALGGAATLDAALGPVRAGLAVARAARRFPLVRLLDQAGPQGAAGGPVALGLNVNVNYYDLDRLAAGSPLRELNQRGEAQIGALRVGHLALADLPVVRPYDLNLGVTRSGGLLRLGLRYRRDLLPRREVDALLDGVVRALGLPAQRDERGPRG